MARYIDADALIDRLLDYADVNKDNLYGVGFKNAITVVETEETADVVERKRGNGMEERIMLYSEFIERTKGKDNLISYCVYKALETVYMEHEEISKTDVYREGRQALEDLMNTTGEPAEL